MSSSKNPLSLNSMCRQKSWWGGEKADIGSGLSDLHAEMRSPGTQRAWQELVIAHNDRRCCRLFLGIHLAFAMVAAPFVTRRQSNRFFREIWCCKEMSGSLRIVGRWMCTSKACSCASGRMPCDSPKPINPIGATRLGFTRHAAGRASQA